MTITAPVDNGVPDVNWAREITYAVNRMDRRTAALKVGQVIAVARETTNTSGFTASTQIAAVSAWLLTGFRYEIRLWASLSANTDNDGRVEAFIRTTSIAGTILTGARREPQTFDQALSNRIALRAFLLPVADGLVDFFGTAARHSGAATWRRTASTTAPQYFVVKLAGKV